MHTLSLTQPPTHTKLSGFSNHSAKPQAQPPWHRRSGPRPADQASAQWPSCTRHTSELRSCASEVGVVAFVTCLHIAVRHCEISPLVTHVVCPILKNASPSRHTQCNIHLLYTFQPGKHRALAITLCCSGARR